MTPRPPPSIGLMASAGRPAAWPRQAEGRTIEVESSSLAPRASPHDRVTTPAGREEPGTSLYPSYNDPPDAPRPRQCQGGDFGRLQQADIAGSGRIWAIQLDPQPAWAGPGRGGHRGGRGGSRDVKTVIYASCSDHQPSIGGRGSPGVPADRCRRRGRRVLSSRHLSAVRCARKSITCKPLDRPG